MHARLEILCVVPTSSHLRTYSESHWLIPLFVHKHVTRENSKALCPFLAANYFECVSFFNILYTHWVLRNAKWAFGVVLYQQVEDDSNEFSCVNANKVSDATRARLFGFPGAISARFLSFLCVSRNRLLNANSQKNEAAILMLVHNILKREGIWC